MLGSSFCITGKNICLRAAKITPKKVGHFVCLWKRGEKTTQPFDELDPYDFYIISVLEKGTLCYFVFPKEILVEKDILSKNGKGGKRGFRLYTPSNEVISPQALKTKKWQAFYFHQAIEGDADISKIFS
jgi:hypothetical protein